MKKQNKSNYIKGGNDQKFSKKSSSGKFKSIKENKFESKKTAKDKILSKFSSVKSKSIKKRKNTLLLEYKLLNKANRFIDCRIGEKDKSMTSEDRLMARFVAQRVKFHKRKELFNLGNDEEVFTHHGRTLEDIEKFDNPRSDESDNEDGNLQADFVKESHFGGGIFSKVSADKSTHQNTIDQLIVESKRKKIERQQVKEETDVLTEQLDDDLKELLPVLSDPKTNSSTVEDYRKQSEAYDILVRQLKFEPVGKQRNKLKFENQTVQEEQKLENQSIWMDPTSTKLNLDNLKENLSDNDVDEKIEMIQYRLRKLQMHTGVSNIENLLQLFNSIIEFIDLLFQFNKSKNSWVLANKLGPILHELTKLCGDPAVEVFYNMIKKKQECFSQKTNVEATPDMVIFLKLVPILFPTSDFNHPIVTPSAVLLSHILSRNTCKTLKSICIGLFLATVALEYISTSNRYCPEVMSFLRRVLCLAVPDFKDAIVPINIKKKLLLLADNHISDDVSKENLKLNYNSVLYEIMENDESKIKVIYMTIQLLLAYTNHYNEVSSAYAVWTPVSHLIKMLPIETYPNVISNKIKMLSNTIDNITERPLRYLVAEKKRPKALRLYEPNIQPVIDGKPFGTTSRVKLEKQKLMHQYKREMKSAVREIRKDRNFLTRVKLFEQAKKDSERQAKVKQILNWGQVQQSEFKRTERKNRFKR